ncbi:MAG: hypothetical protein VB122_03885 [Erysipelotrichales bacterium]|nr:hypothetical protein [Erysipelotrichales bacterium]
MPFYVKSLNNDTKENRLYGCIVRRAREDKNASLNFVAESTFVNPSHLSKIEHGKHAASEIYKKILESSLGITVRTDIEFSDEVENKLLTFFNYLGTCDAVKMNEIYLEFLANKNEYKYSFAFPYYDFLILFYLIVFEKDLDEAKKILDEMKNYKNLLEIPYQLLYQDLKAQYYLKINNKEKAKEIYENIDKEIPSSPKNSIIFSIIYYHLTHINVLVNDIDLAVKYYKRGRTMLADLFMFDRIVYLGIVIANGYTTSNQYEKAINIYENILAFYARENKTLDIQKIYRNMSYCSLKAKNYMKAIVYIQHLDVADDIHSSASFYEPYALWMMGEESDAKKIIETNIHTKNPKSKLIQEIILHSINGETQKSLTVCETACQLIMNDRFSENQEFIYKIGLKIAADNNLLEEKYKYLELLYNMK